MTPNFQWTNSKSNYKSTKIYLYLKRQIVTGLYCQRSTLPGIFFVGRTPTTEHDSLAPNTDKIPETVRITFFQRAVQQNHDLNQIHILDSVWRSKTGSTEKFTFEVYYNLLWNAAYQHDLNKATKQTGRKAFISHQNDPCDDFEHDLEEEDSTVDQNQDKPSPYSVFQSSINSTAPKKPTKVFIHNQLSREFPEAAKHLVIEYNKMIKVVNPKPHFNVGKSKPNPSLGKPNSNPFQFHFHERDDPTKNQPPELLPKL